ncbi:MAG: TIGR01777 family oxidoreductase [Dehalococcoidia bacterium]|nr:TIGR01777 family oxidoreductase [Dehalococcoidia bacterium]
MKIAITGSTGLIGRTLSKKLSKNDHEILNITRGDHNKEDVMWDPSNEWIQEGLFEGVDVIINLSGQTIGGRLTNNAKINIYQSRVNLTNLLVKEIIKYPQKPKHLISASAIGYYGNRYNEEIFENSSPGSGFLATLPIEWEKAANAIATHGVKVTNLRTGLIMTNKGGFLTKPIIPGFSLLTLFKLGIAGKLGNGKQWMSWISLTDAVNAIEFIINNEVEGPVNLVSPIPVTNYEFTKTLGKVIRRPTIIPVPGMPLKMIFGEFAKDGLLGGQKAYPKKLIDNGFEFKYSKIKETLDFELFN